jgi:glycosyltransferase 2 family protein
MTAEGDKKLGPSSLGRKLLVGVLLGVLVYGVFVVMAGREKLGAAAADFRWMAFVTALGLSSSNYVLRFLKWEYYLKRLDIRGVPKFDSFLIFLSGFVLTVTPGKIGEVFKSAVLQETHGIELAKTAPIVIAERLTDVIAVVGLILIGSLGFSGGMTWALLGTVAVLLGILFIAWSGPINALTQWLDQKGTKWQGLSEKLRVSYRSLRTVGSVDALLIPSALSLVGWGLEGLALSEIIRGFGTPVSLPLCLFFYSTSTLAGALVPTPGGLGVAETMMQSQLVGLGGIAEGRATLSMLLIRFATLWWAVLVGFAALVVLLARYPRLFRDGPKAAGIAKSDSRAA